MQVLSVGHALAPYRYSQQELVDALAGLWAEQHHNTDRVRQLHQAVQVGGRHLALPLERYRTLGFGEANDVFVQVGTDMAAEALSAALDAAGKRPTDLDAIFFSTVTGIATPSIDAHLVNRLGLRTDVKRMPMFGLGCVAGAAGLSRMHDYLRAWPGHLAALVNVELCSLTVQRQDLTIPNLVATGLFGDGAAAVLGGGPNAAPTAHRAAMGPRVVATRSRFYPDTERVMGWDLVDSGFQIVLSADVPRMVSDHLCHDVSQFLGEHGLSTPEIGTWICHPGGPRVLEAVQASLDLPTSALAHTWASLREVGNLSSASVLFVLKDTIEAGRPPPDTPGVIIAMGPGFCSELLLVEW